VTLIDFTVDGIKYKMTAENKVCVTYPTEGKPGSSNPNTYTGAITIPAQVTYEGVTYDVTSIGEYAFRNSTVTSITLPEGLLSIGKEAIYRTSITEITVPNSVTTLGESCISENQSLQTLTFGKHIADNKWGVWVAWRASGGYNVYMICDVMPRLGDNQTFDDSHESIIHVYPSVYLDYIHDEYWNCHTIVADLQQDISLTELQGYIATYSAMLPAAEEVGTDPGFYTAQSVQSLSDALTFANSLDDSATLEQINQALLQMIVAADGLQVNPLNEGYYYIDNVYSSKYMRSADDEYIVVKSTLTETDARFFFKLSRKGSNWFIQSAGNDKYFGAPDSEGWMTVTDNPDYEQIITWIGGGIFKIQCLNEGTASLPYGQSSGYVLASDYPDDNTRIQWRFHPAQSGQFPADFNIENIRVREYMAEVTYTAADETKIKPYNVAPPDRRDLPEPATIFWKQNTAATSQQVTWSLNADFADAMTTEVPADQTYYEFFNLLPGKTYYYKVTLTVDGNPTEIINSTFTTSGQLRQIKGEGAANMRDLGGWATASGKPIKYGYIYRGAEWNGKYNLTAEGIAALRAVGIKAELDLRSSNEALYIDKSPLGDDVTYIRIHNEDYYESGMQNRKDLYKQDLQFVFDCVKNDKPVYFHCHIGADRTGTLALILEGLLGVSESDLYKDYELTTFSAYETHRYKEYVAGIMEYINTLSGETLTDKFYTYCHDELGLTAKEIADFRSKMLDIVYETDVKNIVSEAVSTAETYVDLSDYAFQEAALTGNMPAGSNLLVNVSTESGITGQNIINGGVCENLVLTDGVNFATPTAFTAAQVSFTGNVSTYKTLVLPFDANVPANFTASNATSLTDKTVNLEAVTSITANVPVILQGEGTLVITASNADIAATPESSTSGLLQGTYKSIPAPVGSYVLQDINDVVGFHLVGENQPTVGAFRAYLKAPASGVKVYTFSEDGTTGLQEIVNDGASNGKWFNLSGQRLSKPQKGINISGNKKVIIK
jgi:protein tyrosine/serine phosphatase